MSMQGMLSLNLCIPLGRCKLIVNYHSKPSITSDAATVMHEIEIVHPLAKLLVMAAHSQETEVRKQGHNSGHTSSLTAIHVGRRWYKLCNDLVRSSYFKRNVFFGGGIAS